MTPPIWSAIAPAMPSGGIPGSGQTPRRAVGSFRVVRLPVRRGLDSRCGQELPQLCLAKVAVEGVHRATLHDQNAQGDALDLKGGGQLLLRFAVDPAHGEGPAIVQGDLFQDRKQGTAGRAPFRPEIDQDGGIGLKYFLIELAISHP